MHLAQSALDHLDASVDKPAYSRAETQIGIVHLGLGAFHRAHMAAYVDRCLSTDPNWAICGVSLRSSDVRDGLEPQDWLYTLGVDDGETLTCRVIGALKEVLHAPSQRQRLEDRLAAPSTKIVSLTITEKGYALDPVTRSLDLKHPDIAYDLAHPDTPRTAIGWIVRGLSLRHAKGLAPFTLLSCDNLPANGRTLRALVLAFVDACQPELGPWLDDTLASPSTMVDRIVPATSDATRQRVAQALGFADAWPIITEPFLQWVIEDHFPLGRPDWEVHGVTMANDVTAYEQTKLRMLNASHSALAYHGLLAGRVTVSEAMNDPVLRQGISEMMADEIAPTLPSLTGLDLDDYRYALLQRFANPALHHQLIQIASDGSQKLPQRLYATIQDRLDQTAGFDRLASAAAAWMMFVYTCADPAARYELNDPLREELLATARIAGQTPSSFALSLLEKEHLIDARLGKSEPFRATLLRALESMKA